MQPSFVWVGLRGTPGDVRRISSALRRLRFPITIRYRAVTLSAVLGNVFVSSVSLFDSSGNAVSSERLSIAHGHVLALAAGIQLWQTHV